MKTFNKKHKIDIRTDERAMARLRRESEKAKRTLSSASQVKIEIESLTQGIDFSETLTKARFEDINNDLFRKTLEPLKTILNDSGFKKSDIHEVII